MTPNKKRNRTTVIGGKAEARVGCRDGSEKWAREDPLIASMTISFIPLCHGRDSDFVFPRPLLALNRSAIIEDAYKWPAELCSSEKGRKLFSRYAGKQLTDDGQ